jgi:hypothetical protein
MNPPERGHELEELRSPPGTASGITEWKGDIFLEDQQAAHECMQSCAVRSPNVERTLSVYDVISGTVALSLFLFSFSFFFFVFQTRVCFTGDLSDAG